MRALNTRYVVALVVIAALSLGAHLAITAAVDTQAGAAAQINVSGRQRMLTQRIAVYATTVADANGTDADLATLTELVDLLETSHHGLVDGDDDLGLPGQPSDALQALYFGDDGLDAQVRRYVDDARLVIESTSDGLASPAVVRRLVETASDSSPTSLLTTLDRAVEQYQSETEDQVDGVLHVARIVLIVTLVALAVEGVFVFRPMMQRIRAETTSLAEARSRLRSVLDNAVVGVITVAADGRVIDVNATAEDLLATPARTLTRLRLEHLATHEAGRAALRQMVTADAESSDDAGTAEVELRRGDERFLAHLSAQRAASESGGLFSVVITDVTERRRAEDRLRHDALHDELTAMPNRVNFLRHVDDAVAHAAGGGDGVAVMFIDLDDFKTINDSLGHVVGDELLTRAATRISSCMRETDIAARLGGDEFAVMVDRVSSPAIAIAVAERISRALTSSFDIAGHELTVSASIGIALSNGDVETTTLLSHADSAMYAAKRQGKNQHRVYSPDLLDQAVERLDLRAGLSKALTHDELRLHYQPIVDLSTGRTIGLEALLRWTHPIRGPISPAEFIPVAEETGQIVPVGWWVLERGIADAIDLRRRFGDDAPGYMSINVSPAQFSADDFVQRVAALLDDRLPADTIVFELTETAVMRDAAGVARTMAELRALGIRIAIDDFGTGYSALSYLNSLDVDVVKIDRSFIDSLGTDDTGSALVLTMLNMARSLGLDVIAEGIETETQRSALIEMGCPVGQGFHFARPSSIDDIATAISATHAGLSGGRTG